MEERVEGSRRGSPLLNIIDYQHVDGLVEVDEVVGRVATYGVGELHLEQARRDI